MSILPIQPSGYKKVHALAWRDRTCARGRLVAPVGSGDAARGAQRLAELGLAHADQAVMAEAQDGPGCSSSPWPDGDQACRNPTWPRTDRATARPLGPHDATEAPR
jgi:hypothetical protein